MGFRVHEMTDYLPLSRGFPAALCVLQISCIVLGDVLCLFLCEKLTIDRIPTQSLVKQPYNIPYRTYCQLAGLSSSSNTSRRSFILFCFLASWSTDPGAGRGGSGATGLLDYGQLYCEARER